MDKTQILSIEITRDCNLGTQHSRCPNQSPLRYARVDTSRPIDDDAIVRVVSEMHDRHGFRGVVAWHYYCEPLCDAERMFRLMTAIRSRVPFARFLLWTNGTLLPDNLEPFCQFSRIVVTDYGNLDRAKVVKLTRQQPGVSVHHWGLDGRMTLLGNESKRACGRLFGEMVIDYYGNVRPCCFDWEGYVTVGNVQIEPLDGIVAAWKGLRDSLAVEPMSSDAPEACRRCLHKSPAIPALLEPYLVAPDAFHSSQDYLKELRAAKVRNRKIAVVFVSYLKVPEERLQDHFKWNHSLYSQSGCRVYVVSDVEHSLPDYATCIVYPLAKLPVVSGEHRFSICATKNAGINQALTDGADVILCVDVDHAFPSQCWNEMTAVVEDEAVIPTYRMVHQSRRHDDSNIDTGATGAVSMTAANWRRIRWDDRCIGYGADDGIILRTIERTGLRINRKPIIEHVEHPGAEHKNNVPGHGRDGCYGRDLFNFDNFENNRKLHKQ